jgi:hypothetical protein
MEGLKRLKLDHILLAFAFTFSDVPGLDFDFLQKSLTEGKPVFPHIHLDKDSCFRVT